MLIRTCVTQSFHTVCRVVRRRLLGWLKLLIAFYVVSSGTQA